MSRVVTWARRAAIVLLLLLALACNLSSSATPPPPTATNAVPVGGAPDVSVLWPPDGSEFATRQEIAVRVRATDGVGVTRIELRTADSLLASVPSPEENGQTTFEAILPWTPTRSGTQAVEVVAYRGRTASEPVALTLIVRSRASEIGQTPVPFGVTVQPGPAGGSAACQVRVNIDNLRYRDGPGTEYEILGLLGLGETLYVNGQNAAGTWYRFERDGRNVWAASDPGYSTEISSCMNAPIVR
ncbi:MAG: hypothetical protein JW910_03960 [Anaerolineae bacterium]|nr:hypothetical protein [Anaerolineae bacterium]